MPTRVEIANAQLGRPIEREPDWDEWDRILEDVLATRDELADT